MTDAADVKPPISRWRVALWTWTKYLRLPVSIIPFLAPPYVMFIGESAQAALFDSFGLPAGLQDKTISGDFVTGAMAILQASIPALAISLLGLLILAIAGSQMLSTIVRIWRALDLRLGAKARSTGQLGYAKLKSQGCLGPIAWTLSPVIWMAIVYVLIGVLSVFANVLSVGYEAGRQSAKELRRSARVCGGLEKPPADGGATRCVSVLTSAGLRVTGYLLPTDQQMIVIDRNGLATWIKTDDGLTITSSNLTQPPAPQPHVPKR